MDRHTPRVCYIRYPVKAIDSPCRTSRLAFAVMVEVKQAQASDAACASAVPTKECGNTSLVGVPAQGFLSCKIVDTRARVHLHDLHVGVE